MKNLLLAGIAATATFIASHAGAQEVTLKIASFTPPKSNVVDGLNEFIAGVKKDTNGRVAFQEFWGGSLGRNPTKQYEMVKAGIADIVFVAPGYTAGEFPDFGIFELPFLVRSGVESSLGMVRMHKAGLLGGVEDIKPVSFFSTEPYIINVRRPIKKFEDLAGMKIRAAGPIHSSYLKAIGTTPVFMAVTELTQSLDRGVLDGALLSWGGLNTFKVGDLVPYHYDAPMGVAPFVIAMNKAKWEALPGWAKTAIDAHGGEKLAVAGGGSFDKSRDKILDSYAKKPGVVVITPSEAELEKRLAEAMPIHKEWIQKTKDGQKKYDGLKNILADIRSSKKP